MPCLQSGIPALEALHTAWKNHSTNVKYELFSHGLDKAIEKVEEYYEKTGTSDAYTFVMGALFFLFLILCHAQPNFIDST